MSACTTVEWYFYSTQNQRLRKWNFLKWLTWGLRDLTIAYLTSSKWNQTYPFMFSECAVTYTQLPLHRPWTCDFLSLEFISSFYPILNNSHSVCISAQTYLSQGQSKVMCQVKLRHLMLPTGFLWILILHWPSQQWSQFLSFHLLIWYHTRT